MTANDTTTAAASEPATINQTKAAAATTNGTARKSAPSHPLGPLTASEISKSSDLIRAQWPEGTKFQFKVVTLLEPPKAELAPYLQAERASRSIKPIDRKSQVVYYLRNTVSMSQSANLPIYASGQKLIRY